MKRLFVKVCGMRDADNTRRIAELAPDFVGFIFVRESPRYVGQLFAQEIVASLGGITRAVGVFRDLPLSALVETVRQCGLHAVQLHGSEDAQYIGELRRLLPTITILKAVSVRSAESLSTLTSSSSIDYYLFDAKSGGSGEPFDWSLLSNYREGIPFFIAGGVGSENLSEVLDIASRYELCVGIDLNSKVEVAPGMKDPAKIQAVLERIRV